MQYEWNSEKSLLNLEKHGFSFENAFQVFQGFHMTVEDVRKDYGEHRFCTMGTLGDGGRIVIVAHTKRGNNTRIISMRRANSREQEIFNKYRNKHYKEIYDD